jgi:ribosome-binding factor A
MKRKPSPRSSRQAAARHYPRTARLNALLQEIVADYFKVAGDEALGFFTVTAVEVDNDLNVAQVFVSVFDDDPSPEHDAAFLSAIGAHRKAVQRAIAQQAKLRKTPEVAFAFDVGVRTGSRVEAILAELGPVGSSDADAPDDEQATPGVAARDEMPLEAKEFDARGFDDVSPLEDTSGEAQRDDGAAR